MTCSTVGQSARTAPSSGAICTARRRRTVPSATMTAHGPRVLQPRGNCIGREAGEQRHEHGAEAGDRVHRDHCFGDHGQEQRYRVAATDAQAAQPLGCAAHRIVEFGIGQRAGGAVLGLVDDGRTTGRRGVGGPAVDAAVDDVQGAADEPVGVLDACGQVDDPVVGRPEPQAEVLDDRIPVPADVGDRSRPQLGQPGDAMRAGQPGDVGVVDVVLGRGPGVVRHGQPLGIPSMRSATMFRWMNVEPPAMAVPRAW